MGRVVHLEITTGRAWDSWGDFIELRFCWGELLRQDVVLINGKTHRCGCFELTGDVLSFCVRELHNPGLVETVDTPTKCNLEAVAETFNRLSRIERETSQDVLVCETLCGMLVAAGYEVRIDFVSTLVDLYPVGMTPDNLKQTLAIWDIEHTERDHSGPVPPSSFMSAMMTEGLKNDE